MWSAFPQHLKIAHLGSVQWTCVGLLCPAGQGGTTKEEKKKKKDKKRKGKGRTGKFRSPFLLQAQRAGGAAGREGFPRRRGRAEVAAERQLERSGQRRAGAAMEPGGRRGRAAEEAPRPEEEEVDPRIQVRDLRPRPPRARERTALFTSGPGLLFVGARTPPRLLSAVTLAAERGRHPEMRGWERGGGGDGVLF